ncbi:2-oxoisovalerate dehydrogenase E1 component, beta subunit [Cryptococcus gattii Ru294]|uniref:3-methyl-2-oxobutanoate dehydrogenase (2-methylpropanoyl-transferring) n=2 Tax=Cryptococcus gattii TaxID=37769 RepID=E6QXK2_CRYGW|nr:Pyruvate dehydrogenase (acetyl-transferring), putative [Cryptococcus gattii WM276]KIR51023.1 2-oxoisovalerate dehydrogenase E1 component, beta subunit [Cryptococcus gattii Ru294]KIR79835.1 2-oxoisovalerate dehydrogenase E1 component, beta subunit [Cryptococcus gattii EJB2]KIY36970.1 2-oxoisovalerate dehydrogenase E1 component, beta subunit [Cryptococcus gattii E566]KJE00177.1 2-oxoisovalerate dehydrogenase E1 component, beta subunit [Cryptococcus gattii NT-10]ADV19559.1 Pyruvate dehydrogena
MVLLTGSRMTQSFLLAVKTRKPPCLCLLQSEQRKHMSTNDAAVQKGKPRPSRSAPAIIDMQSTTEEPPLGESELFLRTTDEALNTPGMKFSDGHGLKGPTGKGRQTRKMNLYQAIRDALGTALATNPKSFVFGEDVETGVFRCTTGLVDEFGKRRVFNTPLTEQGIAGFGIGLASVGGCAIAEIQFGDYIFPAFDQLVNEAAKQRYASGGSYPPVGGSLTIRAPIGTVGHGGLYHSQSPEGFFLGAAGLKIVIPRSPIQAKGLLLAAIRDPSPTLFFEPKILYRAAVEEVPIDDYTIPMGQAEVLRKGADLTVVSYGTPLHICMRAINMLQQPPSSILSLLPSGLRPPQPAPSIELIDLRTINPLPLEDLVSAVRRTGRLVIVHEAGRSGGVGNNIAGEVGRRAFEYLEAPVGIVSGWDTPVPLSFERFYQPDVIRVFDKIVETLAY